MRYLQFEIRDYRAITGPLVIDVRKKSLFPIIGINESGKTTILQALFAFDHYNDDLNEGRHLEDVANLYSTSPNAARVAALVKVSPDELRSVIERVEEEQSVNLTALKRRRNLPAQITIEREIKSRQYSIREKPFSSHALQGAIAKACFSQLPYILYFDDFRDKVEQRIEIPLTTEDGSPWSDILEQLFKQTNKQLSIFKLAEMEERQRKSTLAKVQRHLNNTLTREWQNFRLDDAEALEIALEFEPHAQGSPRGYIKLEVVERGADGDDHYFFISDRSKGFYWFFNFVMKLEFNPKFVSETSGGSIYLLDEPGSYLHATAQAKLCTKLKTLSERNTVLYCTHSHYLLNPDVIPLSSITVADKDGNGSVGLIPIDRHRSNIVERRSAFQPVVDALQIKPFLFDMTHSQAVIVEGIYDYYALETFRKGQSVSIIPSVGADSIKFYVSLMLAWQVRFRALWDNDAKGRAALSQAKALFGLDLAERAFLLLPIANDGERRILQDLFASGDLPKTRSELGLDANTSFEKTMATLFFSPRREEIVAQMHSTTHERFAEVWKAILGNWS